MALGLRLPGLSSRGKARCDESDSVHGALLRYAPAGASRRRRPGSRETGCLPPKPDPAGTELAARLRVPSTFGVRRGMDCLAGQAHRHRHVRETRSPRIARDSMRCTLLCGQLCRWRTRDAVGLSGPRRDGGARRGGCHRRLFAQSRPRRAMARARGDGSRCQGLRHRIHSVALRWWRRSRRISIVDVQLLDTGLLLLLAELYRTSELCCSRASFFGREPVASQEGYEPGHPHIQVAGAVRRVYGRPLGLLEGLDAGACPLNRVPSLGPRRKPRESLVR